MTLRLNGIAVDCVIGERPDERTRLQRLRVDVALELGDLATLTDELADTVDYAALTERIRSALAQAQCRMIERSARIVAETCLADKRVRKASVSVTKCGAIANLESATVDFELSGKAQ